MAEIGKNIEKAKSILEKGGLVAIPTETVYGLAANALNPEAILKIYKAKKRPSFDPLISHFHSVIGIAEMVTEIPEVGKKLANNHWPGPLTLLLNKRSSVPDILTSGLPRMAVRIPDHPLTLKLLESLKFPLAAPSANPFGYVSPTRPSHVNDQLGGLVDYILDGGTTSIGIESTIIGFDHEDLIVHRLGGLKIEELSVYGKVRIELNKSSNPIAPGMLKSHYSPRKKLIVGDLDKLLKKYDHLQLGIISFKDSYPVPNNIVLSTKGDLDEAASNLFTALRNMDNQNIELILTELFPDEGLGMAINDRLKRASSTYT